MYIPNQFAVTDKAEIVEFMKRFSFATIITAKDGLPIATHLPVIVTTKDDNIILTSHMAKANEQWKDFENNKTLVIFSEPHAYISPKHYDKGLNVPTWNYIAVHAYGQGTLITDADKVIEIIERTINTYDLSYKQQWDNFPSDYKLRLIQGLVAFDIIITDLQGKKKLSQNKNDNEQQKIINALSKSEDTNEQLIADYMKNNAQNKNSR
ncbi:FMN-binding negative transcriptional regulator [Adhaeribacter aquaticus]|uniref:FMN-binding negative transcriptional regulator n=1 Tax=Adhaeribacter aquaticus TaxID=299567 RepID=UPI00042822F8|nr:FMN-binding negative transcriptional regulator [Adhaeribacter aquaticus]